LDTSTLRWILIVVGVVIVVSIFLFGNPEKKRKPKASRLGEGGKRSARGHRKNAAIRREPTLEGGAAAAGGEPGEDDLGEAQGQGELAIDAPTTSQADPQAAPQAASRPRPRKPAGPAPDKIVSLFLLARDNHVITGADLLQATVSTGMEFGDMNIFHRLPEGSERPVFSLANAAKPGHFERDAWNTFETTGLALFMTLPGPVYALDGWDAMLATARRIGELLNAEVLDDERNAFTRQREAQIREEMRDYDRRKSRQQ
jgi:cell division protein ZipA